MTETADTSRADEATGAVRTALRETFGSLHAVFANPALRRLQLALAGSQVGDWAYSTAVAVWAYEVGGAKAVGIWMAIRLTLMALTAPFLATFADRYDRKRVMVLSDLVRVALVVAAAACLYADAPTAAIFVLATLAGFFGTPFRAARQALTPSLASTPAELTASNGAASTIESLSAFLGPAIGASLLAVASVQVVFLINAATFVWSMLLVSAIRMPRVTEDDTATPDGAEADEAVDEDAGGFLAESMAGFRIIARDRSLLLVVSELSLQTVIAGATAVLPLVIAVEILGTGARGVGYLEAILGVGSVIGGFVAIGRASRQQLAMDMTVGVILWSLPLVLVTISPTVAAVVVAMLLLGLGNPLVDVNADTIIQRLAPDEVLGRVFGALETCIIATMAIGAAVTPLLLHLVGLRSTLAILGLVVAAAALAGIPQMRRLDARLRPPAQLGLLEQVAIFAPLPQPVRESLARSLEPVAVAAGEVVLREGDESDRFFIIESGRVQVTQGDRVLREEGPGDFFGEIGLLRDVPRTATITALEDTVLQALERAEFLEAVGGTGEARRLADDVANRRLAF